MFIQTVIMGLIASTRLEFAQELLQQKVVPRQWAAILLHVKILIAVSLSFCQ